MNSHDNSTKKSAETTQANSQKETIPNNLSTVTNSYGMSHALKELNSTNLTPNAILQLQGTIGNQAVQRLIENYKQQPKKSPAIFTPPKQNKTLQREESETSYSPTMLFIWTNLELAMGKEALQDIIVLQDAVHPKDLKKYRKFQVQLKDHMQAYSADAEHGSLGLESWAKTLHDAGMYRTMIIADGLKRYWKNKVKEKETQLDSLGERLKTLIDVLEEINRLNKRTEYAKKTVSMMMKIKSFHDDFLTIRGLIKNPEKLTETATKELLGKVVPSKGDVIMKGIQMMGDYYGPMLEMARQAGKIGIASTKELIERIIFVVNEIVNITKELKNDTDKLEKAELVDNLGVYEL